MKRTKKKQPINYIDGRINQLIEDKEKVSDPYDLQWYNRMIQELEWTKQVINNKYEKDCALKIAGF